MNIKAISNKLMKPTLISVVVLFAVVIFIVFTSWILYNRTVDTLTQNLKDRFLSMSIIEAVNIDSKDLEALQTEYDWKKPEWAHVVNQLHKAKYSSNDIVFMYIFRKTKSDPTKMEFVADADSIDPYANTSGDSSKYVDVNRDGKVEPDGPDKLQWPGQPYPEAVDIPEAYEAYKGPLTVKNLYTDEYGTVLTGYAPIKDENGNTIAILGTDIKADDFFMITRQTLRPFLIFIASLSLIISILILIIIYFWKKNSKHLQEMNENLNVANERQENLIHFINHQVKGFFTKSKYIFSALMEGDYGRLDEKMETVIKEGLRSDNEGIAMVEDILNTANIKSGVIKYDKSAMDFKNLVLSVVSEQEKIALAKNLSLETNIKDEDYEISGDEFQLRHMVKNLIDNSIKYTPTGKVTVFLSKYDGKILFSVKDTGVGLSNEDKKKLFTEGGKGKNSQKVNVDSTGFGLFIAKNIVLAHGGKIWAESDGEGKGSEFWVELSAGK